MYSSDSCSTVMEIRDRQLSTQLNTLVVKVQREIQKAAARELPALNSSTVNLNSRAALLNLKAELCWSLIDRLRTQYPNEVPVELLQPLYLGFERIYRQSVDFKATKDQSPSHLATKRYVADLEPVESFRKETEKRIQSFEDAKTDMMTVLQLRNNSSHSACLQVLKKLQTGADGRNSWIELKSSMDIVPAISQLVSAGVIEAHPFLNSQFRLVSGY